MVTTPLIISLGQVNKLSTVIFYTMKYVLRVKLFCQKYMKNIPKMTLTMHSTSCGWYNRSYSSIRWERLIHQMESHRLSLSPNILFYELKREKNIFNYDFLITKSLSITKLRKRF